jgi:hypothetical protein
MDGAVQSTHQEHIMQITPNMNLDQLAEHMGDCATADEARAMRDLLVEAEYESTGEVPEAEWLKMLDLAAQQGRDVA